MPNGGQTLFTEERIERLLEAFRKGAKGKHAAGAAGIHVDTFYKWQKKGRDEMARLEADPTAEADPAVAPFVDFVHRVEAAKGAAVVGWLQIINDAAPKTWTAAAWLLERTNPEQYGRRVVETKHSTKDDKPLKLEITWVKSDVSGNPLEGAS